MTDTPLNDELVEDAPPPFSEGLPITPEADASPPAAEAEPEERAESEPEPEPDPAPESPFVHALERLDDRLAESQRLLSRQTEIAASLHEENQRLKEGELRRAQAPLVRDVLRVHDDVKLMLEAGADEAAAHDLDLVRAALLDALARNGIEAIGCEPGAAFDPKAHKVAGVVSTSDPELDRRVAAVVRPGFAWDDGDAIRVVEVQVYKHRPPAPDPVPEAHGA